MDAKRKPRGFQIKRGVGFTPAGWVSRPLSAMVAGFRLIDCRSLDVLLVCEDDLAPRDASPRYERS